MKKLTEKYKVNKRKAFKLFLFNFKHTCVRSTKIIPTKQEFLSFLRESPHQTYTAIAKHFDIEMGTVRDLVKSYSESIVVRKIGTALMVDIK